MNPLERLWAWVCQRGKKLLRIELYYLFVVTVQAIFIILYGWLDWSFQDLNFIKMCKLAAVAANFFIIIGFFIHLVTNRKRFCKKCLPTVVIKLSALLLFFGIMCTLSAVTGFHGKSWFFWHFITVILVALAYLGMDSVLSTCFVDKTYNDVGKEYKRILDYPNICAFLVLFSVYNINNSDTMPMYEFASGAITFQWLASNAIFVSLAFHHAKLASGQAPPNSPDTNNACNAAPPD